MKWPAFIGGSFQPQSGTADNSRTVNLYVEPSQGEGATVPAMLLPTPGVDEISAAAVGPGRAHLFQDGREFAIMGHRLYEIDGAGTMTNRGTVGTDNRPATITTNGDVGGQLFITSNRNGFYYNLTTNVLTQIAALNGLAFQGAYLDGYFLNLDDRTSTVYISALADGSSWTLTDSSQRSIGSDPFVSMIVCGRFLWLFGELTTEIWYNTADTFPFSPHPSGYLNFGIGAPWSRVVNGANVIWLATTKTGRLSVVQASGFSPQVVSTYAMDSAFENYPGVSAAIADVMTDQGHTFYLLSFDTAGITWAWDSTTSVWCERGTWLSALNTYTVWRPRYYARAFGEHRMLDASTSSLWRVDTDLTTDVDGNEIRRVRRCPAPFAENKRVFYSNLELDLEPGLGNAVAPGDDPQVMLRISNDGGKTFSIERWASAGKVGEYGKRVDWSRLGAARRRVFEVVMTDPIKWRLSGAYLEAEAESG